MPQTFTIPPDDESSRVPHWVQFNARTSPEHPLFVYGDVNTEAKSISWLKAAHAFGRAAKIVDPFRVTEPEGKEPEIFGILANLDFITYYTFAMGIFLAGYTPFLISTRNSPAAVSHLLKKTGTRRLFVSPDDQMQKLAAAAQASAQQDGHRVDFLAVPTFQDLYPEGTQDDKLEPSLPPYPERDIDSPAFILHSSGTTSFPKPITIAHRGFMQAAKSVAFDDFDLSNTRLGAHALPPFHAMAFFPFSNSIFRGQTLAVFPPRLPPTTPSPASVLDAAVACKSTVVFAVPIFIELWSRTPVDVEKLKALYGVVFSGGPLNKQIGDELTRKGVNLCSLYATTEIGVASKLISKKYNLDWAWHNSQHDRTLFLPQNDDPDVFEIVFVETSEYKPSVFNSEVDGKRAFSTNDLVVLHPNNPTKFMIYGRKDDQLMLSTGEKTNPGPLETIICRHPRVHSAVYFGRGRTQNGVIIQPAPGETIDPTDTNAVAQFRNDIWKSVEEANAYAPTHSRIYKEMILIASPSKPFEMTAKLAPRKPAVIQTYQSEIEAVYIAAEESIQSGIDPPSEWTPENVRKFVRDTVWSIMDAEVADDDDIFVNGGDSLKATYIRNSLAHALRSKAEGSALPQSFVYSNPTISLLAVQLLAFVEPSSAAQTGDVSRKLKDIDEMIAEFCVDFPHHQPSLHSTHPSGEIVLLTGTTGALGVQLLAHLISLPEISRVYALNRPASDGKALRERQAAGLLQRGLDAGIIDSPKVTLVEGDTTTESLGIDSGLFAEIRDSITLIIHNAWRVNFNIGMRSFTPMVKGVRNLVNLALHSPRRVPPRIILTSTVGVFGGWKGPGPPLELPIDDPKIALGTGYGESKFVAERILERASETTSLKPIIVRIGQMTSNHSGAWNSGDWLPSIVRSGQVLGALPARNDAETVAWISIDAAARAIVDFRTSESQHLHLVHPNPVPWNTIFQAFSLLLNVPLVPWANWLDRLEKNKLGPEKNPAAHLVGFFRNFPDSPREHGEAPGIPLLDITQALKSSPSLADPSLDRLGPVDAERWVAYWKRKEHLALQ